jgi:thymidylate synthase (FAD)
MKVHDAPLVILVTRPSIVWEGIHKLLAEYGLSGVVDGEPAPGGLAEWGWRRGEGDADGDSIPELMGRLCYGSWGGAQGRVGAMDYVANILAQGHGSVLAHAVWGFVICRAGRGFTHQMVRHGVGTAISQESQHFIRYSVEGEKNALEAAICAAGIPESEREHFRVGCEDAVAAYARLWKAIRVGLPKDAKVKKIVSGAARGLLPNALESRLGFSANARALRHVCELRGTADNTLEIRLVAAQIARIMMAEAPAIFQDFSIVDGDDGHPVVASVHRKV